MKIITVKDQTVGGKEAFELVKQSMTDGAKVLGLATGSTPITLYKELVASDLDFTDMTSINLDEYVGLKGTDKQSYRYFMNEHLFNAKPFKETFVPNGVAEDSEKECERYNEVIASHPIDLQILGIGSNGHIGFNEPGAPFDGRTRRVGLVESTIEANQRFFDKKEDVPTEAYSMGIASIMDSKQIILMAFGEHKAQAIKGMIEGPVTPDCPASILQKHDNVIVITDEEATALLTK